MDEPLRDHRRREFDPSRFFESFLWVARELLVRPRAFFRNLPTGLGLRSPLVFLLTTSFLAALCTANYRGADYRLFVLLMSAQCVSSVLAAVLLHGIAVKLCRTAAGFGATLRVVAYAGIVDLVAWLPVVGVVPYGYGLYLMFLGLQEVHRMTPRQAGLSLVAIVSVVTVAMMALVTVAPDSVQEAMRLMDPQEP